MTRQFSFYCSLYIVCLTGAYYQIKQSIITKLILTCIERNACNAFM